MYSIIIIVLVSLKEKENSRKLINGMLMLPTISTAFGTILRVMKGLILSMK